MVIDNNPELLALAMEEFPDVKVVPNSLGRGNATGRNTGIVTSSGDLVAFLDDDAVAEPDWLLRLEDTCADEDVLGAMPAVDPIWQGPRPAWFPDEFLWTVGCSYRGQQVDGKEMRNLFGPMMLKRSVFQRAGMFSGAVGRNGSSLPLSDEETELCVRARDFMPDGKFVVVPSVAVLHKVPASRLSWRYFMLRCYAEGLSKAYMASIIPGRKFLHVERSYVTTTLAKGIWRGLAGLVLKLETRPLCQAAAMGAGLCSAVAGYAYGAAQVSARRLWRSPQAT